jgi:hypothetical protein
MCGFQQHCKFQILPSNLTLDKAKVGAQQRCRTISNSKLHPITVAAEEEAAVVENMLNGPYMDTVELCDFLQFLQKLSHVAGMLRDRFSTYNLRSSPTQVN